MSEENPKLFVSYSWSNPQHQQWVIELATRLREAGIDVILDKWDLREGQDSITFMEKMVTDPDIKKVIIICDRIYSEKSSDRSGGVGTETQIISPEIYSKEDQTKFVAVLSERDENGEPYLPTYYKSRIYIDLSNDDLYASNFEQLLRWIYDKPLYIKPELGNKPSFLSDENPILLGTNVKYQRALDAFRSNRDYRIGALEEYFTTYVENLDRFRIINKGGELDDHVYYSIEQFLPFKNEALEIFLNISRYYNTNEIDKQLHNYFERLIPYMFNPKNMTSYRESEFDNFRFIIQELFLNAVAALIKYERFDSVAYLLDHYYYIERNADYGRNTMVPFTIFDKPILSLIYRNDRLKKRRISIEADLLIQRTTSSGITDHQLMQADLILFLRDAFDSLRNTTNQRWYPITLIYAENYSGSFELFARAQSVKYFSQIGKMFNIKNKTEFVSLAEAFKDGKLRIPTGTWNSINPLLLVGIDKLATIP